MKGRIQFWMTYVLLNAKQHLKGTFDIFYKLKISYTVFGNYFRNFKSLFV